MRHLFLFFCIFLVFAASCNSDKPATSSGRIRNRAVSSSSDTDGTPGDWYMRLNGSLGGKPIVAHLFKYGRTVGGYYQFAGSTTPVKLTNFNDSILTDDEYYLTEQSMSREQQPGPNHWSVQVKTDGIVGKWMDAGGKGSQDLSLKEAYPEGSIPLNVYAFTDTGRMWPAKEYPRATTDYGIVWPETVDKSAKAAFLRSQISVDMKLEAARGPLQGIKNRSWRYFGNYRLDIKKSIDSSAPEQKRKEIFYQFAATFHHYVLYNDQDWLILESEISNYTGGAHGIYGATYQNLDLAGQKSWKLSEIVTDTASLVPVLNAAARKHFNLQPQQPLDGRLLVSAVPVTYNFYLNAGGLTFVYNPYDIAAYADGVISLFIPYNVLMPLLNPEFKKRANLDSKNGAL